MCVYVVMLLYAEKEEGGEECKLKRKIKLQKQSTMYDDVIHVK